MSAVPYESMEKMGAYLRYIPKRDERNKTIQKGKEK